MSCLTNLNQSAPSKFNFFFYLTNQFDNKIPHLIHQTVPSIFTNSNLNSSVFILPSLLLLCIISGITLNMALLHNIMALIFQNPSSKPKKPFFAYALPSICLCSSSKKLISPRSLSPYLSHSHSILSSKVISIMAL